MAPLESNQFAPDSGLRHRFSRRDSRRGVRNGRRSYTCGIPDVFLLRGWSYRAYPGLFVFDRTVVIIDKRRPRAEFSALSSSKGLRLSKRPPAGRTEVENYLVWTFQLK